MQINYDIGIQKSYNVALIGCYPPPFGGVSVHIKRFKKILEHLNINCTIFDLDKSQNIGKKVIAVPNKCKWIIQQFFSSNKWSIIHFHMKNYKFGSALLLLKLRSSRIVFTFHSLREDEENKGMFTRFSIKLLIKWGDYFIAVAPHIRDKLVNMGVQKNKISVIPAFIPPAFNPVDHNEIPYYIRRRFDTHSPILTANASRINFYKGVDLYGIDMCIGLCAKLRKEFPKLIFVFCLPEIGDFIYFNVLFSQLQKEDIIENFLFVNEPIEYYQILKKADIFIRPTNTDGDAVSIREALFLGTPVICSNVVQRPKGVTLFKNRDLNDLYEKTRRLLVSSNVKCKKNISDKPNDRFFIGNNSEAIIDIYNLLLQEDLTKTRM